MVSNCVGSTVSVSELMLLEASFLSRSSSVNGTTVSDSDTGLVVGSFGCSNDES